MAFCFWLFLHVLTLWVTRRVMSPEQSRRYRAQHMRSSDVLSSWLYMATPLSWLYSRPDSSPLLFGWGVLLYVLGAALGFWALLSNPHFRPDIVAPQERITTGAYGWFDHPGYVAFATMNLATVLILQHWQGLAPFSLYVGVLVWRARQESKLLPN